MIILGIDPGYSRLGWAIVKKEENLKLLDFDCLNLEKISQEKKFLEIGSYIDKLIKKYKPQYLAIEKIFFAKNVRTAIKVAQIQGVVILKAKENKLKVVEIAPNELKSQLTGWGLASKEGIKKTLSLIFNLDLKKEKKFDDAYDALALAVVGQSLINFKKQQENTIPRS